MQIPVPPPGPVVRRSRGEILKVLEEHLTDPVTHDLFEDPQTVSTGSTVNRASLQTFWKTRPNIDPATERRSSGAMHPSRALKQLVDTLGPEIRELELTGFERTVGVARSGAAAAAALLGAAFVGAYVEHQRQFVDAYVEYHRTVASAVWNRLHGANWVTPWVTPMAGTIPMGLPLLLSTGLGRVVDAIDPPDDDDVQVSNGELTAFLLWIASRLIALGVPAYASEQPILTRVAQSAQVLTSTVAEMGLALGIREVLTLSINNVVPAFAKRRPIAVNVRTLATAALMYGAELGIRALAF